MADHVTTGNISLIVFGLSRILWLLLVALAFAGAIKVVSVVIRNAFELGTLAVFHRYRSLRRYRFHGNPSGSSKDFWDAKRCGKAF